LTAAAGRGGTRYTRATLADQVRAELGADLPGSTPAASGGGRLQATVTAAGGPADLAGCLRRVGARGTPVAVDVATFEGTPAAVVVVQEGSRSTVWVVPRDCGPARGTRLAVAPLR